MINKYAELENRYIEALKADGVNINRQDEIIKDIETLEILGYKAVEVYGDYNTIRMHCDDADLMEDIDVVFWCHTDNGTAYKIKNASVINNKATVRYNGKYEVSIVVNDTSYSCRGFDEYIYDLIKELDRHDELDIHDIPDEFEKYDIKLEDSTCAKYCTEYHYKIALDTNTDIIKAYYYSFYKNHVGIRFIGPQRLNVFNKVTEGPTRQFKGTKLGVRLVSQLIKYYNRKRIINTTLG